MTDVRERCAWTLARSGDLVAINQALVTGAATGRVIAQRGL